MTSELSTCPANGAAPIRGSQPFNVHGHRLSSLYRVTSENDNPFNVLKILNGAPVAAEASGGSIWGTLIREGAV